MAEVRVEGGKGHQRHGWVLKSLVRHQGRPKGTSTGGGDPPRDGNALSEREPNIIIIIKCFDLSFSWFLEVPRADLSVPHPSLTIYSSCLRLVHGLYSLPWPRAPFRLRFNVSGRGSRVSFGRLTQVTEGGMTFGDSLTLVTQPTSAPYPLSSLKF